jgi:hypothetical protein
MQIALVDVIGFLSHRHKEYKGERSDVCHKETYQKGWQEGKKMSD